MTYLNKNKYWSSCCANATVYDLVTGKKLKGAFGYRQVEKTYSGVHAKTIKGPISSSYHTAYGVMVTKIYYYNFVQFYRKLPKKYLRLGYPFKIMFESDRVAIAKNGGLRQLEGEIRFLESTGKHVPYTRNMLSVKNLSNLEACERLDKFRR